MSSKPLLPQHNRYDFVPLPERKDYSWPGGKRLAFVLTTNVEWFAFGAGLGHDPAKHGEPQTHRNYSWRDYGNRIGVWRLFELFDELEAARCAQHQQPALRLRAADHGGDPQARRRGGGARPHQCREPARRLWQPDEERLLREVTETIARHEGAPPAGWMGAGAYENAAHARSPEGDRLQVPHGLADGRPAGLAAHARGADPLGAVPDRAQRLRR